MSGEPDVLDPRIMGVKKGARSLHLDSPLGGSHNPDDLAKETSKRMDMIRKEQEKKLKKLGY